MYVRPSGRTGQTVGIIKRHHYGEGFGERVQFSESIMSAMKDGYSGLIPKGKRNPYVSRLKKQISTSDEKEVVFWDCEDSEKLVHEDQDDAVECFLDSLLEPGVSVVQQELPETIEVKGYARMDVGITAEEVLEAAIDTLDQEYGDPNGDCFEPTEAQMVAAQEFADKFNLDYRCYACEPVVTEVVNTMDWIRENRSDWLEDV